MVILCSPSRKNEKEYVCVALRTVPSQNSSSEGRAYSVAMEYWVLMGRWERVERKDCSDRMADWNSEKEEEN